MNYYEMRKIWLFIENYFAMSIHHLNKIHIDISYDFDTQLYGQIKEYLSIYIILKYMFETRCFVKVRTKQTLSIFLWIVPEFFLFSLNHKNIKFEGHLLLKISTDTYNWFLLKFFLLKKWCLNMMKYFNVIISKSD